MVQEKRLELERLKIHYESLRRVEGEQQEFLEQLAQQN